MAPQLPVLVSARQHCGECSGGQRWSARHVQGVASEPQRLLYNLLGDFVELLTVIPPHLGGIYIRSTLIIGL